MEHRGQHFPIRSEGRNIILLELHLPFPSYFDFPFQDCSGVMCDHLCGHLCGHLCRLILEQWINPFLAGFLFFASVQITSSFNPHASCSKHPLSLKKALLQNLWLTVPIPNAGGERSKKDQPHPLPELGLLSTPTSSFPHRPAPSNGSLGGEPTQGMGVHT